MNMIHPKSGTDGLLLSKTENCEALTEQTHRKAEETLEFKMIKPKETFHFNPPIHIKRDWMLELTDLEVYNSIFNIRKENNKFELYTDTYDKFSFEELKDQLEELLDNPNVTDDISEHETKGPRIIKTYWKLKSEKSSTDGCFILLMGYARSPFRDFEGYLRIVFGLNEDDIRLILKQYNANFVTYELEPANYTLEDIQKAVYPIDNHEGTLQNEYDDLNKKTKIILTRFGSTFGTLRIDNKTFSHTLLDFTPFWDYKPTNAIHANSPGVYTSNKILNIKIIIEIHLKCDVFDGSIQNVLRQPNLFSFPLDKPSCYKVFCEPELFHYKKVSKSVLNIITFYLEDNDHKEVDFF